MTENVQLYFRFLADADWDIVEKYTKIVDPYIDVARKVTCRMFI